MATNHGVIGPFGNSQEDWLSCIARLQNYFIANDIAGDKAAKHRAILLSVCGVSTSTYRLIKSLAAPSKPEEISFENLVKLVEGHHNPEPSATVQHFKFHSQCRQPGETVSTYVAELRASRNIVSSIISKVCCATGLSVESKTQGSSGGYWLKQN